jgi:hypothetical protein
MSLPSDLKSITSSVLGARAAAPAVRCAAGRSATIARRYGTASASALRRANGPTDRRFTVRGSERAGRAGPRSTARAASPTSPSCYRRSGPGSTSPVSRRGGIDNEAAARQDAWSSVTGCLRRTTSSTDSPARVTAGHGAAARPRAPPAAAARPNLGLVWCRVAAAFAATR